jgi:hypothetical protein
MTCISKTLITMLAWSTSLLSFFTGQQLLLELQTLNRETRLLRMVVLDDLSVEITRCVGEQLTDSFSEKQNIVLRCSC